MSDNTYKPGDKFLLPVEAITHSPDVYLAYRVNPNTIVMIDCYLDPASLIPITRLSDLEAENARLREALGWQPIETAPKDGSKFLAYGCLHARGWNFGETPKIEVCIWDGLGSWYAPSMGGWSPTHWMPLPEPPTS